MCGFDVIAGLPIFDVPLDDNDQLIQSKIGDTPHGLPPQFKSAILHHLDILDKYGLLLVVTRALVLSNTLVITKNDFPGPTFGIELPPIFTDHQGQLTRISVGHRGWYRGSLDTLARAA
jgi:hypothetical protein